MVAAGRALSLGYFDHPPASWWLSWGAAHLFGSEAPIVVRLPFILLFALSTWLMFRLGTEIADARAGFYAALLLNLSPVFGVTTGTWVLPDGPLDCALLGATLALVHALPATGRRALAWWLACGLFAGLALFSKYSAILWICVDFLYLLSSTEHRRWLLRPAPWLAVLVVALVFLPVAVWNATHGWASLAFQGERAVGLHFRPFAPLLVLGGEALFVLPWIWAPMLAAALAALRRGPADRPGWLLCCLAAPPILGFALVAAWSSQRVLFHWAAPGYLMLFPLLGQAMTRGQDWLVRDRGGSACDEGKPVRGRRWLTRWQGSLALSLGGLTRGGMIATAGFVILALLVVSTQVRLDWLGPAIASVVRRDPDIEGIDWTSLRSQLAARDLLARPGLVIGADNWRDGGKIAYALGPDVTMLCLNTDARQFGVATNPAGFVGHDVLLLVVEHPGPALARLAPFFDRVETLPPATITLRGRVLATVSVFRGINLRGWPSA